MASDNPQWEDALAEANQVKAERGRMCAEVKNRTISVSFLVLNNPKCLRSMTIGALLCRQTGWGRKRALRLLARAELRESKPVGDLTWRQRNLLVDLPTKK